MDGASAIPEPVDAPTARHSVLGTSVAVTTEGPYGAPPILLVAGVPGTTRDYRYLAPLLAKALRVHRLDLPGYGAVQESRWADYSPEGRARLVVATANALGLNGFAIAGHSMGGPAAIATAAMVPHRITALVALASVGTRRHRAMKLSANQAAALHWAIGVPLVGDLILKRSRDLYRKMRFPTADTMTRRDLATDMAIVSGIDFARARRRAAAVRAKTLVAWAEDDPMLEGEIGRELCAAIEDSEALVFPTGGHNIQKTRAVELAAKMIDLIATAGAT